MKMKRYICDLQGDESSDDHTLQITFTCQVVARDKKHALQRIRQQHRRNFASGSKFAVPVIENVHEVET